VFAARIAQSGKVPLELDPGRDSIVTPFEVRAATLESFYDPAPVAGKRR